MVVYDPSAMSKMSRAEQGAYMALLPTDSKGPQILYTGIVLCVIMVVFVSMRIYTRAVIMKLLGSDDYLILLAAVTSIFLCVYNSLGVKLGSGKHMWLMDRAKLAEWGRYVWISTVFYTLTVAFMKISVLLQVLRITARQTKMRWVIIGLLFISSAFFLVSLCLHIFQCTPVTYAWERYDSVKRLSIKATCINSRIQTYLPAASNVAMDLLIWAAPMPVIWNLQLPKFQKISLYAVFSVGGIVCIAAIVRLTELIRLLNDPMTAYDQGYNQSNVFIWSVIEADLAIILASIPPLRPLFKMAMPSVFGSLNTPSKNAYNSKDYYRQNRSGTNGSQMRSDNGNGFGVKNHVRVRGVQDHDEIQEEWETRSAGSSEGKGSVERLRQQVPTVVKPERGIVVRSQVEVAVEQSGRNGGLRDADQGVELRDFQQGRGGNVSAPTNGQHGVGVAMGGGRGQGWER